MNLADCLDEIADALDGITGLNVYPFAVEKPEVPCAVVGYPESLEFDQTYGRGSDRMTVPLFVLVSKVSDKDARNKLGAYVDGSGSRSIKAALQNSTYTAFDSLRVQSVDFEHITANGIEFLGAVFNIDLFGPGST